MQYYTILYYTMLYYTLRNYTMSAYPDPRSLWGGCAGGFPIGPIMSGGLPFGRRLRGQRGSDEAEPQDEYDIIGYAMR